MGLDMYLSVKKYVGDWNHSGDAEKSRHKAVLAAIGLEGVRCDGAPALNVLVNVAYWRKANQIHAWFVQHCQEGVDDCRPSYVSREQIEQLRDLCSGILADRSRAGELPPSKGFFFGSGDVDDRYYDDLANTVKQLNAILTDERLKDCEFSYRSSW